MRGKVWSIPIPASNICNIKKKENEPVSRRHENERGNRVVVAIQALYVSMITLLHEFPRSLCLYLPCIEEGGGVESLMAQAKQGRYQHNIHHKS